MTSFVHALTLIFVIAKITGYIDWSWWLVFLPSIAAVLLGLSVLIIPLIIAVFVLIACLLVLVWEWVCDR